MDVLSKKHNIKRGYLAVCQVIVFLGWVPLLFIQPMIHGGTLFSTAYTWTSLVFGGYCSLEIIRASTNSWSKCFAILGFVFYGFAISIGLYCVTPYISALFTT